jgi:hypothetical protein
MEKYNGQHEYSRVNGRSHYYDSDYYGDATVIGEVLPPEYVISMGIA